MGLDALQRRVEMRLSEAATASGPGAPNEDGQDTVTLTARHKQAVSEAIESVKQAAEEIGRGHEEIAATMIRAACQAISDIESQPVDEQVLDRIFSRFCIGK